METITEPTSEASATNEGENTNANLNIESLASSFMERVENEEVETLPTVAVEESDATQTVESEEEQEGEVLSQSDNDTEEDFVEESDDS